MVPSPKRTARITSQWFSMEVEMENPSFLVQQCRWGTQGAPSIEDNLP
jgi:hypothetical protein